MVFITLSIVFALEFTPAIRYRKVVDSYLDQYFDYLSDEVSWVHDKGTLVRWGVSTGIPVAISVVAYLGLSYIHGILGFLFGVAVVFFTSSFLVNHNKLQAARDFFLSPRTTGLQKEVGILADINTEGLNETELISLVFYDYLIKSFRKVFAIILSKSVELY